MGSKTTTQNTTTAPDAAAYSAYQATLGKAARAANQPFQSYTGEMVAPVNAQQNAGIGNINAAFGSAAPDLSSAENYAGLGAAAINPTAFSGAALQQYESPFQSDVINATMAQIANQDAQQQQVIGNSISSGAFGGDRTGVAQANLAGQQALANNATFAGLNNQNFSQALGEFNNQQALGLSSAQNNAARAGQAAFTYGNLGSERLNTGLTGANAQLAAGALQQGTQQAQDTATYGQFENKQAYPFQTAQFLAGVDSAVGPQLGGTSNTEGQGPSPWNSIVGAGLAAASFIPGAAPFTAPAAAAAFAAHARGGRVPGYAGGGSTGGMPYGDATGYVPALGSFGRSGGQFQIAAPNMAQQQQVQDLSDQAGISNLTSGAKLFGTGFNNSSFGDAFHDWTQDNLGFARGGNVRQHFDAGGGVDSLAFDPSAMAAGPSAFLPTTDVPMPVARPADLGSVAFDSNRTGLPSQSSETGDGVNLVRFRSPVSSKPGDPISMPTAYGPDGSPLAFGQPVAPPAQFAPAQAPALSTSGLGGVSGAILGQESGNSNNVGTSVDGAMGPGQIMPATFAAYAKSGERIDNPDDNRAVHQRIVQDYTQRYNGDPARIATAYFSGPGNVAPPGSATPYLHDYKDGNGKSVSGYVSDVLGRMNGSAPSNLGSVSAYAPSSSMANTAGLGAISSATANDNSAPLSMASGDGLSMASQPRTGLGGVMDSARDYLHNDLGVPAISDNGRTALLSAGLGMMASRSPWLGTAIGEGGLAGVAQYGKQQELTRQQAATKADIDYKKGELSLGNRKQDLVERQYNVFLGSLKAAAAAGGSPSMAPNSGTAPPSPALTQTPTAVPPPAGAPSSGAPSAPGGPTAPSAPPPAIARNSDPAYLEAMAEREEAQARASWMNPDVQKIHYGQAQNFRTIANSIRTTGLVTTPDGRTVVAPGFAQAKGSIARAEADARSATESKYRLHEVQPTPGGPTEYRSDASLAGAPNGASNPVGAGSPPGSSGPSNAMIAKQPAFIAQRQEAVAKDEGDMLQKFQARQVVRQRLETLSHIMQSYQTGSFAEHKADLVGAARAMGLPIKDSDTANPEAFQKFTKNAVRNVMSDAKDMGGRVLATEIQGFMKANANAELQPGAAASIVGQGIGLLNYEDKHTNDYFAWKKQNPNAYDTSQFELPWAKSNPMSQFTTDAEHNVAAKGVPIPPNPADRVVGQRYVSPSGKVGRWNGSKWEVSQ